MRYPVSTAANKPSTQNFNYFYLFIIGSLYWIVLEKKAMLDILFSELGYYLPE